MELTGTRVKVGCTVVLGIAVLAFAYWKLSPGIERPIDTIVADLQKRSMPTDGRWLDKGELEFGNFSVNTYWEIEWDQGWDNYCEWIETRFGDFKIEKNVEQKNLLLLKRLSDDTLRMTIEAVSDNPLCVRVSFKGYPS